MARIEWVDRGARYIDVRIVDLDSSYNGKTRTVHWWWGKTSLGYENQSGTQTLSNKISKSSPVGLNNLSPSTEYSIRCVITGINDGDAADYTKELDAITVWTLDLLPHVGIENCYQNGEFSEKKAYIKMRFSDVTFGVSTYQIEARKQGTDEWYPKGSETIIKQSIVTENGTYDDGDPYYIVTDYITFDDYATYEVRVKVSTNERENESAVKLVVIEESSDSSGLNTSAPRLELYKDSLIGGGTKEKFGYVKDNHAYTVQFLASGFQSVYFTQYQYQYRKVGSTSWITSSLSNNETGSLCEFSVTIFEICSKYEVQFRMYAPDYGVYTDWSNICQFETQGVTSNIYALGASGIRELRFQKALIDTLANDKRCTFQIFVNKFFNGAIYDRDVLTPAEIQRFLINNDRYIYGEIPPTQGTGTYSLHIDITTVYNDMEYRGIFYSDMSVDNGSYLDWTSLGFVTNINLKRVNKGLEISWSPLDDALTYNVYVYDSSGKRVFYKSGLTTTSYSSAEASVELNCSTFYEVGITPINRAYNVNPYSYTTIITAPSQPILSCTKNSDGEIAVSWTLEQPSSTIDIIYITLYKSDGTIIERKSATATLGNMTFTSLVDGDYVVKSITEFDDIQCVDEDGNNYTAKLSVKLSGSKPSKWVWTQIYELSTGGTGTICAEAYVPIDENGLHPVTADEWNDFTDKVNEMRAYASSIGKTVSGSNLSHVNPGDDFYNAYNLAVAAIKNIQSVGGDLPYLTADTQLSAHLLLYIASELNAVLNL